MEPARAAPTRRRPRRGSVDRPLDTRLVRNVALLLAAPLAILVLTISRTGSLPAPGLPPSFDGASAAQLTRELVRDHPSRVPGSLSAAGAAEWFREKISLYGLAVHEDAWQEDVPGLGRVTLRNLAAVIPGSIDDTIVIVAHRDNRAGTAGANDDASGTAALVELARAYARVETGSAQPRTPLHTIVLLSTDAGAYGDLGAARYAGSKAADTAVAALVLDGLAGRAAPHLAVAGLDRRTPPTAIVRTLSARLAEEGAPATLPDVLTQLVGLGIPLGLGEQAPLLGGRIPAVRVGTAPETAPAAGSDELPGLDAAQLGRMGRAIDATLGSLDAAVELHGSTRPTLVLSQRAVAGWALELVLLVAVAPFAAAALDLLARCRRRGVRVDGAWRAYRRRLGFWLLGLVALGVIAATGALPLATELPPRPDLPPVDSWPTAGIALLLLAGTIAWLRVRVPLVRSRPPGAEQELAGWTVALLALLGVAALVAIANPFTLVFVLPSLYSWLALVQIGRGRGWVADVLYGLGLTGPIVALVVLAQQLDLGIRAPLYAAALVTSGTVPWLVSIALAAWLAVAAQVGALVSGRYAPAGRTSRRT